MPVALSALEVLVLVAIARLGDEAYGVTIQADMCSCTGRDVSIPAVYAALERLEHAGLTKRWLSETRCTRGGRARRHYHLTAAGHEQVRHERESAMRMWRSVPLRGSKR